MSTKIIRLLYLILFSATPILMVPFTSEIFEFNKMIFIYIISSLVVFFWILKMIGLKKIILKKTPFDIPIILFLISLFASWYFSIDRQTSFYGYYGRFNGGVISIVSYILLYYGLVANEIDIYLLLKTSIFTSVFVILWGLPGRLGHDLTCLIFTGRFDNSCWDNEVLQFRPESRVFSTLGQPNWLGAYLVINFFLGFYFLLRSLVIPSKEGITDKGILNRVQDDKKTLFYAVYLFVNFTFILFTRSRSALLAVVLGMLLLVIGYWVLVKKEVKKLIIIFLIVVVIPILLFKSGISKIDNFLQFPTSIFQSPSQLPVSNNQSPISSGVTESLDIRKIVWRGAVDLGLKYPLFGTGPETFAYSYYFVRPKEHNLTSEWDYIYNKAHNEFLNYLATTGFIGLISYLGMIGTVLYFFISNIPTSSFGLRGASKNKKDLTMEQWNNRTILILCLLISYITILITNFFGFSTTTINLFFYLIPGFIVIIFSKTDIDTTMTESTKYSLNQKILVLINSVLLFYIIFSVSAYYLADINYSYGIKYANPQVNNQQRAAGYFENALKLRHEHIYKDRLSSSLAYLSAIAFIQKETDLSKKIADYSDRLNKETLKEFPLNIFYWKTRAKNMFYFFQITENSKELEEGIDALKKAEEISPTDPKIPYSLVLYYSYLYDIEEDPQQKENIRLSSIDKINRSIALKPNYRDAYFFKGQILKKYGIYEEAGKTFRFMLKNFDPNDKEVKKELETF